MSETKLSRKPDVHKRRLDVLWMLPDNEWVTPMDIGGYDASYHSHDLLYLVKRGLVEKERRYVGWSGGSNLYHITESGKQYLKEHRK